MTAPTPRPDAELAPGCGCETNEVGDIRCHRCGERVNVKCWNCGTPRGSGPCPTPRRGEVTEAEAEPYLVEWATEVDTLGTKEIWDSEEDAREMAERYGQRLFRVEWTEVEA